jgi:hypothetical protein
LNAAALAREHALLASLPVLNHMARCAGLLLSLEARDTPQLFSDGADTAILQHGSHHAHTLSLSHFYLGSDVATGSSRVASNMANSLANSGAWQAAWSVDALPGAPSRITLPAVPACLVEAAGGALRQLGRNVTFDEPCTTWEAPFAMWETLARAAGCVPAAAVNGTLTGAEMWPEMSSLSAVCGLPVRSVSAACRHRSCLPVGNSRAPRSCSLI